MESGETAGWVGFLIPGASVMRLTIAVAVFLAPHPWRPAKSGKSAGWGLLKPNYPAEDAQGVTRLVDPALDKDRYDYIVPILEPGYVDTQLRITAASMNGRPSRKSRRKGSTRSVLRRGVHPPARTRPGVPGELREPDPPAAHQAENDPETVKELRKLAREGEIQEGGDAANVKHADVKDRTLILAH